MDLNGKLCTNNLKAFYDDMISSVDDGRWADIVYFNLSKVSDTVSFDVLIDILMCTS